MKINDIADIINVTEKDPATSGIDIFVGLEHYDIAEPVIKRFGSTKMLSTAAKKFETGDVLIARRNVYLQRASVARFAGLTSGDSIVLRVKKDLDIKGTDYDNMCALIPFILNSINFWDYANTNADGTMSKRLSPAMLLDYEFTLPSLAEQKVLAEKLWAAYEVKQSYLKMIAATEEMVKARFIEMFDFHELNLNSPSKDFESMCFDDTSSATKIPAGDYLQEGKYAIYDQAQEKVIAGYYDNEQGLCRNYPAILFGDHSRVVKYIKEPFFIGADGVKIIRPKVDNLTPEFLYYDLKYHNIPNTGYNRHFKYIKMLRLTKASLEDQSRFLSIAHQADKSISELRKSVDAIDKVIKSLINENL